MFGHPSNYGPSHSTSLLSLPVLSAPPEIKPKIDLLITPEGNLGSSGMQPPKRVSISSCSLDETQNTEFSKEDSFEAGENCESVHLGRAASFLDGFSASIVRSVEEFGAERPPTADIYEHLYQREQKMEQAGSYPNELHPSYAFTSNFTKQNIAYEQAQLLLVSLLENFCALYDRNPDKNRRLFMAVCRQLWNMGILTSADFFHRSEALCGVYKEAFRKLVLQAIESIESNDFDNIQVISDENNDYVYVYSNEETADETSAKHSEGSYTFSDYQKAAGAESNFETKPFFSRLEAEFKNLKPIGRGGFAHVFKGEHRIDHCEYAFKRIEFKSKKSELYEKIIREIKSLAHLEHPYIVRYHGAWVEEKSQSRFSPSHQSTPMIDPDFAMEESLANLSLTSSFTHSGINIPLSNQAAEFEIESPGYYMIIQMELCQFTLADWLEQRNHLIFASKSLRPEQFSRSNRSRVCIPPERMATLIRSGVWEINPAENFRIFKCIVKALQYIHAKGIIHRDLKPGNIIFQVDGDQYIPKIGDFGLASERTYGYSSMTEFDLETVPSCRSFSLPHLTRTTGLGTCMYAAPEQIRDGHYTEKVDIYSLGIILFEFFHPFATRMERHNVLEELKNGIIPTSFMKSWPKEATFIWSCISVEAELRPSAEQIFDSEILEHDPEETIERLAKENHALKKLLDAEKERARILQISLENLPVGLKNLADSGSKKMFTTQN